MKSKPRQCCGLHLLPLRHLANGKASHCMHPNMLSTSRSILVQVACKTLTQYCIDVFRYFFALHHLVLFVPAHSTTPFLSLPQLLVIMMNRIIVLNSQFEMHFLKRKNVNAEMHCKAKGTCTCFACITVIAAQFFSTVLTTWLAMMGTVCAVEIVRQTIKNIKVRFSSN